jgi:L-fuconolactonase
VTATVDSHHHFWDLERFQYDWMPTPPNGLRRRYFPEDMAPLLAETGVSSTVLVEAHSSLAEADFLLDMAEASDFVAGVVAWIDLQDPEVGAELERLKKRPSLVGIRHPVEHDPDEAWLSRDESVRGLRELARADLTYDLLLRPHHLKDVPPLADKLPDLRMVVDRIAKPPIATGEM